ncbi:MAG TPA: hypothetical protein VEC37_01320 [Bacillota bacterium]|nr:hypothetical protein [Bacillota bacterium]
MAYPTFPNIVKPNFAYDETPEDAGITTQFENGPVASRARFTKSRLTFSLAWSAMSATDKAVLMDFYRIVVKGSASLLIWTHPDPNSEFYNQTFQVRVISPPKFSKVTPGRWAVSLTLQEGG